ncbi:hypothetical protein Cgig2_027014 [Carnegiea gigantea]|uniref:Small ribosomal subunit protein bS20c n=1 Tax=Carnegiea gigantea TaxID=171969 RepID=A0A9Q1JSZ8_9CARY|nr:hypothetical protein Cgig2_027014 [Carnegiea gigantea]
MAVSMACFSSQCFSLASHFNNLSLSSSSSAHSRNLHLKSLTSSLSVSQSLFSQGCLSLSTLGRRTSSRIVCDATPPKEADSAAKRARQAKTRRLRNKSRKSEIKTRMKKVLVALAKLKKKKEAQPEEILPIEKLIAEAYSCIDKAVVKGTLHRNTGAHRKSRLARNKKAVEIHHGWYTPASASTSA